MGLFDGFEPVFDTGDNELTQWEQTIGVRPQENQFPEGQGPPSPFGGPIIPPPAPRGAAAWAQAQVLTEHEDAGPQMNPPFNGDLRRIMPEMGPVRRGRMVTDTELMTTAAVGPTPVVTASRPYRLNFLFNPTTINYGYNRTDAIPYDFLSEDERAAINITSGAYVNFQLLFDRTHEYANGEDSTGVGMDIEVFQKMTGIWDQGVLVSPPVKVIFGEKLWMRGFIVTASITYAHFSYKMTPLRALVDIGVESRFSSEENIDLDTGGKGDAKGDRYDPTDVVVLPGGGQLK